MREKLKEFQNSPRSIIAAFSAAVLFFCTVFTRLILKPTTVTFSAYSTETDSQ